MSKAHLRSILENSVDTVYCFNMQTGHFEYVSPSVKVMTGISSEEFLSMDIEQLVSRIHPDYRSAVSDAQKLSEKTGNAIADYLFLAKDGQYRWISDHMRIVKDDEGKSLYRFGNSRDITELKNTEKALQESETKYRTIVETASEGIWQVDGNLKTVYANEKMAKMLGYSDSEIIGRYVFDFLDEGGKRFAKKWHERRVMGIEGSFEYKFVRKDGTYIITATNVSSLKDDKGNFIGSIGLITDITERKKMEESFRATQHKLNLALENANIGIWEWDLTTGEVIWDERTELMFGLKPGSFGKTQKAFEDLVYEEDLPRIRNAFQNALEKNLPYEVVFRKKADSNYYYQGNGYKE